MNMDRCRVICTKPHAYEIDSDTGCWNWLGALFTSGYGAVKMGPRPVPVHRVFYTFFVGDIPDGQHVHHACENLRCVRPDHLQVLPPGEHYRRHAKLNWDVVDQIRLLGEAGPVNRREIARLYGVTASAIGAVLRGTSWRRTAPRAHVPQMSLALHARPPRGRRLPTRIRGMPASSRPQPPRD